MHSKIKRAQYDIQHKNHSSVRWKLAEEASDSKGIERDGDIQDKLLSILYVKRRQDTNEPGVGNVDLERLSGCPREHLEFHLWYLKAKGWIARLENGMLAITVEGVDRAHSEHRLGTPLTDASEPHRLRPSYGIVQICGVDGNALSFQSLNPSCFRVTLILSLMVFSGASASARR